MIGVLAGLFLFALIAILVPLRFARAVRRAYRDPRFRSLLFLVVATLAAGTTFYWYVEGWSLLDAFYFSSITLTTVGYGDLAPATPAGKLFTVFYIFAGLGIIVGFADAIARASVEQRGEARRLRSRRGEEPERREEEG